MPPVGFEPTISAAERLHTYTLDRTVTGIGYVKIRQVNYPIKWRDFSSDSFTLEHAVNMLSRNVGKQVPTYAV
jgi:hypothetical protein